MRRQKGMPRRPTAYAMAWNLHALRRRLPTAAAPWERTAAGTQCCTLLAHAIAYSSAGPGANRTTEMEQGTGNPWRTESWPPVSNGQA
ncbi:hypothetical protein M441DRAFT_376564 [Trichoderma asperellum CBS 433.97]|uniref:Uncharacterized protein n=1 Tax=Trichoderma asperellum (strain ATCC 204424 / CBS 433.97 / NBRC 101777) TaxID=1042311 RepID=A0A2T3ZFS2_TRIA4|nr:hypothetical protein M441DRAFT_376564 [Trichoderma asperellum CBS 433.97]PTB43651.1 hypothetical protein M441DRAFT_376564 [Trichoderma asperellum CBS 433.97]WVH32612.1 hypothetical protein [Trichoderma asperellum]